MLDAARTAWFLLLAIARRRGEYVNLYAASLRSAWRERVQT